MSFFKRSASVVASPALVIFAVVALICLASQSSGPRYSSAPGPLTKAWRWFAGLHFGWQFAIICWVTVLLVKAFCK